MLTYVLLGVGIANIVQIVVNFRDVKEIYIAAPAARVFAYVSRFRLIGFISLLRQSKTVCIFAILGFICSAFAFQ